MKAFIISLASPFKKTRWVVGLVLLILPVLLCAQRAGQPPPQRGPEPIEETPVQPPANDAPGHPGKAAPASREAEYVPGQVLVRFRSGTPKDWMRIAHGVVRGKVLTEYSTIEGLQLVRIPADLSVEEAVKLYQRQPEVLYAEPDYILHAAIIPDDPFFFAQWNLHNTGQLGGTVDADIDAPEAWEITTGSLGVEVVVIDSGIEYTHNDLAPNMVQLESNCSDSVDNDGNGGIDDCRGFDFANNDNNPLDDAGHGTHVAGIIGARGNNGDTDPTLAADGTAGVSWQVGLIACKFLAANGSGSTANAINCLNYTATLKDLGRNIVATNNSWGGGPFSQSLQDAIAAHISRNILFIAAAGNDSFENNTLPHFPSNYYLPNVISVASTDRNDARSVFSNFGRQTVDIGAPGTAILSSAGANPVFDHSSESRSGTSMATPLVTGVAALLKANNGSLDYRAIKNLILSSGDTIPSMQRITVTGKRLNAHKALTCSNSEVNARQLPVGNPVSATLGVPVTLAALHINCANPAGDVQVMVSPGNQTITLLDNGLGQDQAAGDGIYTGQWTPSINSPSTLTFPGGDVVRVYLSPITYTSSQPAFSYRNITGTNLNLVDDSLAKITPPFPIQFGGTSFPELFVASNGTISLSGPFIDFTNFSLPDIASQVTVFPFWDDLVATGADNVYFQVIGSAPNRELVVEWRNIRRFNCASTSTATFQVVFFENSSNVLFNYLDTFFQGGLCGSVNPNNGGSATVGVQIIPISGFATQFSINSQSLSSNLALLWTFPLIDNPVPSLSTLMPNSATAGQPGFTLTVNGSNFVNGSVVRWNNADRATTFVHSDQVTASIPASDIATPGSANVTVFNPAPGGGPSNTLSFNILAGVPTVTSLQPDTLPANSPQFILTVNGAGFANNAVVRWNGVNKVTTFINSTKLTAIIPNTDVLNVGTAQVRVFNPPPGGGLSNAATFTINIRNPLPTITGLSPAGVIVNSGAFTLTVLGSNFVFDSVVRIGPADRITTFVNGSQLQAAILAGDITTLGPKSITVFSSQVGGGGGTSNAAGLSVQAAPNPVPATGPLSPMSVVAGSVRDTLTLTVPGSNFVPGSVVRWNGSNRLTMFNSPNGLTATIPASDLVAAGTAQVTVFTPVPGGGTSNFQTFTINNPTAVVSSLSPNSTAEDGPDFTLTVIGSNFVPGAVVRWAGSNRTTTFIGNSQLRALIPASDIANPGMFTITVVNPGAAASNSVNFTVN